MIPGAQTSPLTQALLGDVALAEMLGAARLIAAMLRVEIALAEVQAGLGLIPEAAARAIAAHLATLVIAPEDLAEGMARDGVPVPALLAVARRGLDEQAASALHFGATSQDIVDTAWVLVLREAGSVLTDRLHALAGSCLTLAEAHAATPMLAHTRMQAAIPTSFGLVAAGWADALLRQRARLARATAEMAQVQQGGAAGNLAAMGSLGPDVMRDLAQALDLACPALPWHSHRDRLVAFGQAVALAAGTAGKIATDIVLAAQSEVAVLSPTGLGGSSTMPHKANPVAAEVAIALARMAASRSGELAQAMAHAQERDGAAWAQEWLVLPDLVLATGAALRQAQGLIDGLRVDTARMRALILADGAPSMAEACVFALARHMPKAQAARIVADALTVARARGVPLPRILAETQAAPIDWAALERPETHLGAAGAFIAAVRQAHDAAKRGERNGDA